MSFLSSVVLTFGVGIVTSPDERVIAVRANENIRPSDYKHFVDTSRTLHRRRLAVEGQEPLAFRLKSDRPDEDLLDVRTSERLLRPVEEVKVCHPLSEHMAGTRVHQHDVVCGVVSLSFDMVHVEKVSLRPFAVAELALVVCSLANLVTDAHRKTLM